MANVGLIILAAGASSRMGTPKQLLPYRGQRLIQHAVKVAIASVCDPVMVVLGANGNQIQPELADLPVQIVTNPDWADGMSTSIHTGITALQANSPAIKAVVVMVCDQPFVSARSINQLVEHYETGNWLIVASEYAETLGVPALFHHTLFPELMALRGDAGARKIIQTYRGSTFGIPDPQSAVDIDTPVDYSKVVSGEW